MSLSPEIAKRQLRLDTGVPTAEIFVIDGRQSVVARGIQSVAADLSPGIYKIRCRVGNRVSDEFMELPPGEGDYWVPAPQSPVVSSIPMSSSSTGAPPPSAQDAFQWSREVHVPYGKGSRIFIFVNEGSSSKSSPPGDELALQTFDGKEITSLANFRSARGCRGCTIEVDPGSYLLRLNRGDAPAIEQSIYAAEDWETQIFIPFGQDGEDWGLDLSGSAILMGALDQGFVPDWPVSRWTEAAREALAYGRGNAAPVQTLRSAVEDVANLPKQGVDDATLRNMLKEKFVNPMLGIYGAHLMVLQTAPDSKVPADATTNAGKGPDLKLVREVLSNLQKLVGNHPDVTSLRLYLNDQGTEPISYALPPMLRSSWSLIVQNSTKEEIVPSGSYAAQVAGNLWGSGAWLMWKATALQAETVPAEKIEVDWKALAQRASDVMKAASAMGLSSIEETLLKYLADTAQRVLVAKDITVQTDRQKILGRAWPVVRYFMPSDIEKATLESTVESISPNGLTSATGIPYSVISEAGASLSKRFGVKSRTSLFSFAKSAKS